MVLLPLRQWAGRHDAEVLLSCLWHLSKSCLRRFNWALVDCHWASMYLSPLTSLGEWLQCQALRLTVTTKVVGIVLAWISCCHTVRSGGSPQPGTMCFEWPMTTKEESRNERANSRVVLTVTLLGFHTFGRWSLHVGSNDLASTVICLVYLRCHYCL
jgi:hypothetical protein